MRHHEEPSEEVLCLRWAQVICAAEDCAERGEFARARELKVRADGILARLLRARAHDPERWLEEAGAR